MTKQVKQLTMVATALLCTFGSMQAATVEDFFAAPEGAITVTNDSSYLWTVNAEGELVSSMHEMNSSTIYFTNNTDSGLSFSLECRKESGSNQSYMSVQYYRLEWDGNYYSDSRWIYDDSSNFETVSGYLPAHQSFGITYSKNEDVSNQPDCAYVRNLSFAATDGSYTDDFGSTWSFNYRETAEITGYSGSSFTLSVPETVEMNGKSYRVEKIGSSVFSSNSDLSSVTLPASLKSIGESAFYNCSNLISVNIPDSVTSIGNSAFYGCSVLNTVSISDDSQLKTIGSEAFRYCYNITTFNMPSGVTEIGSYAFCQCENLTSIKIPDGVKAIESGAFMYCNNLRNVSVSAQSGLQSIGSSAFYGATLEQFYFPATLTSIGDNAFDGCYSLKAADLSGCTALTNIGGCAFRGCSNLTTMTIPDAVTSLGESAFADTRLKSVTFGSNSALTSIGAGCFQNTSLQSITLPKGVGSIFSNTFDGCTALKSVTIPADGQVKSIGMNAFNGCSSMSVLVIPATVTSIASAAFNFGNAKTVLVFASANPSGYDGNMFGNLGADNNVRVKIPASALTAYQTKYPGIDFITTDVQSIALNYDSLTASVNNDYQLVATVQPQDAINAISWASSDETIATVDANGLMHCVAAGNVTITATAQDGSNVTKSLDVEVKYVKMDSIRFAKKSYWMKKGNVSKVGITTTPANASDRAVTFATSDPTIAAVDAEGNVTALAVGKCTIYATSVTNAQATDSAEVEVRAYKPARWVVEDENGDGYYTLRDAETGLYAWATDEYYVENVGNRRGVLAADYGEGDSGSEWAFCTTSDSQPVTTLQEDVPYYLLNRKATAQQYYGENRYAYLSDSLLMCSSNDISGCSEVTLKSAADGGYYLSVGGNLVQEETTQDVNLGIFRSATTTDGDWDYTMGNTPAYPNTLAATLTSYRLALQDVNVPEKVVYEKAEYPVYGLNENLFWGKNITSVKLPASLRYLGGCAFSGCSQLKTVNIPEGVTNLPYSLFQNCSSLNNVELPSTLRRIEDYAFQNCTALTQITLSKELESVTSYAFDGCSALTTFSMPAANAAYATTGDGILYKKDLSDIVAFPQGKTGCYSMPATVTAIRDGLFENCTKIDSIIIADGVKKIGQRAFYHCNQLSMVSIPSSVKTIEPYAFGDCQHLTEVTIPASVDTIYDYAFDYEYTNWGDIVSLDKLAKVTMESTVPPVIYVHSFGASAYFFVPDSSVDTYKAASVWKGMADRIYGQSALDVVVTLTAMDSSPALLPAIGGDGNTGNIVGLKIKGTMNGYDIMIIRNKMKHLRYLDLSEATIKACDYNYYENYHTTDNAINDYAFYDLDNLRSVILPQNILSIGCYAFANCANLEQVVGMPETCLYIGEHAFEGSGLKHITIGACIKTIPYYAFASCGELKSAYIGRQVETIGYGAFSGCSALKNLVIPASVRTIDGSAFSYCSQLDSISFDKGVEYIGYGAFQSCNNLKDLKLPSSVTSIGEYAFNGCSSLKEIHVPSMLKSVGDYAFTGCNVDTVFAYTLLPVPINQNTFDYTGILSTPKTSYWVYYLDTQWSQFTTIKDFPAQYDEWYTPVNTDLEVNTDEAIIRNLNDKNAADGVMEPGSGLIFVGSGQQLVKTITMKWGLGSESDNGVYPALIEDHNLDVEELRFLVNCQPGKWYFFCFPFDIKLTNIQKEGRWVWRYYDSQERANNGQGGWKNLPAGTDSLKAYTGYIFQTDTIGNLNIPVNNPVFGDPDKNLTLQTYSAANSQVQDASWNFVGNPTLSYYSIGDLAEDYNAPITVWNAASQTYDAVVPGDDDYILDPCTAIFVQKTDDTDVIPFEGDNRMTYTQAQSSLKAARRARARHMVDENRLIVNLGISNGEMTDKTRIVFNDDHKMEYELGCDASKFMSGNAVPQIYSIDDSNVKYSINERPNGNRNVRLGYKAASEGTYTLSAQRMDCMVLLKDNLTGLTFDLSEGDYEFSTEAGTFDDRFLLVANGEDGLKGVKAGCFGVETVEGGLCLTGMDGQTANVYNVAGQEVASASENGVVELPAGTYVVKMGEKSKKVIVK